MPVPFFTRNYVYETHTSRLHTMTDARGSVATYAYNVDNTLSGTTYSPGSGVASTPNVSFTYDSIYNRVTGMTDGTGTTSYSYNAITGSTTTGAGRLASVSVPIAGSTAAVAYGYDALGRVTSRTVDSGSTVGTTFDSLGRVTGVSNPLGAFGYTYVDETSRLDTVTYPNWQKTKYCYFNNVGDQRLKEIKNYVSGMLSNTPLSDFQYTYNAVGTIATWQQQADSSTPTQYALGYDNADQLTSAVQTNTSTSATVSSNGYNYDPAGNRLLETTLSGATGGQFNNLNQLTALGTTTSQTVAGNTSAAVSSVTANAVPATIDSTQTNFTANVPLPNGTNVVSLVATPTSSTTPVTTQREQIVTSGTVPTALTYDLNGNTLTDENGNTYTWDALNRLISITYPGGASSAFAYDGLSRRVSIIEKNSSGTVTSTKNYLWIGSEIAEERDASNTVTKRFFPQGEQQSGTNYYYTRDHLGSVREMCSSSGAIVARYSYDPYGRTTLVSGSNLATFQYGGYYAHQVSGLLLTNAGDGSSTGRPYDASTGRWLSRDPIGEAGGIDLYGYVQDNPENMFDPSGESPMATGPPGPGVACGPLLEGEKRQIGDTEDSVTPTGLATPWQDAGVLHGYVIVGLNWEYFAIFHVQKRLVQYLVQGHKTYVVQYWRICHCLPDGDYHWVYQGEGTVKEPYKYTENREEYRVDPVDKPDEDVKYPKPPIPPEM